MSTKYILHGGVTATRSETNRAYFREMVTGVHEPRVLLVYFAKEPDEYEYLYERDTGNFAWANPGVDIGFTIATQENLAEQIESHNVIYFIGGETQKLIDTVGVHDLSEDDFDAKVVSGSSAGAYLLSRCYYANSRKAIFDGLGILPIAVWAHFRADRGHEYWLSEESIIQIENDLSDKVEGGPVVKLPEQEFVVYES